jgi:hypothetical protein
MVIILTVTLADTHQLLTATRHLYHSYGQCCGSRMFIPDSGSNFIHPRSRIGIKEFKYVPILTQKIVSKLSDDHVFIPDPDFLPIPDPGVKKAPDPGSGSATLVMDNTAPNSCFSFESELLVSTEKNLFSVSLCLWKI